MQKVMEEVKPKLFIRRRCGRLVESLPAGVAGWRLVPSCLVLAAGSRGGVSLGEGAFFGRLLQGLFVCGEFL